MDWMQIVSALALIAFIVILLPSARQMMKNSPKGSSSDWMSFIIPISAVILFILLLIKLV
jgi:TRAP-type C4-dicarboxylate transport system permease small subunit